MLTATLTARTAVIAELAITFPDTFKDLLPRDEANDLHLQIVAGEL